jgi:PPOX class probable F420-dependent enzyme
MSVPLSPTALAIVRGPNVAVLATVLPDGSPQTTAVWVHEQDGALILATTKDTLKYRNLLRESRLALTVFLRDDPYVELNVRGRVTSIEDDDEYETLNMFSEKYYGVRPYPYLSDDQEWVKVVIETTRVRSNKELPNV